MGWCGPVPGPGGEGTQDVCRALAPALGLDTERGGRREEGGPLAASLPSSGPGPDTDHPPAIQNTPNPPAQIFQSKLNCDILYEFSS